MKFYLVKETSVATSENRNFAGQIAINYYGVGSISIGCYGTHAEATHAVQELSQYMIEEYGYSRKCDAVRNWVYKNPENSKYWKSSTEIVEIEI